MNISAITVLSADVARVRDFDASGIIRLGESWMNNLEADLSGRLVVDVEDDGLIIPLDVTRGPGLSGIKDRVLRSRVDLHAAARQLITLHDAVSRKRLTSSLVLAAAPDGPETQAQVIALGALFATSVPWNESAQDAFPGMARVVLEARPCVVTVHVPCPGAPARMAEVADGISLCLGAALLHRSPDVGGSACARAATPRTHGAPRRGGKRGKGRLRR